MNDTNGSVVAGRDFRLDRACGTLTFGQIRTLDVVRNHQFERRLLGMKQSNVTVP
jgi:hypothetical protein